MNKIICRILTLSNSQNIFYLTVTQSCLQIWHVKFIWANIFCR